MKTRFILLAGAIALSAGIIMPVALAGRVIGSDAGPDFNPVIAKDVFSNWNRVNLNFYASGISCVHGKQIVRSHGFDNVRSLNCGGRSLIYLGRQDGKSYTIVLSRSSGSINVDEMGY